MSTDPLLVAAGAPVPSRLPAGAVVALAPGDHPGGVYVEADLDLRGLGATLDAHGRGAVVHVAEDGLRVVVAGPTLRGGRATMGAGLLVEGASEVVLRDVTIEAGHTTSGRGAAVAVLRGRTRLEHCRVRGELLATNVAELTLVDTVVAGDVVVREGARVSLRGGAVEGWLHLRGTTTRHPTVEGAGCRVARVENDERLPGDLTLEG